jgi:hypothetical protein
VQLFVGLKISWQTKVYLYFNPCCSSNILGVSVWGVKAEVHYSRQSCDRTCRRGVRLRLTRSPQVESFGTGKQWAEESVDKKRFSCYRKSLIKASQPGL